MQDRLTLLIVDDDVGFVHAAAELARGLGYEITVAGSVAQAMARLRNTGFDLALIDLTLPDGSGLDLLEHMELGERTQVILITGHPTVESALKALHLPIVDYVLKPLQAKRFGELLETASHRRRSPEPALGSQWHGLAGGSAAMDEVRRQICRVAPTEASIFIDGESGVGKELVASAIHAESGRAGSFVAINCGAVPSELLPGQLFDAFEQARGGTLFLDEIAEMPVPLQVHLLRALESRSIRRAGGSEDIRIDVRVVSASHRSRDEAIREGRLREDLYYRLAEFPMAVPALRERMEDIPSIAQLFLKRLNERYGTSRTFARDAVEQLQRYSWPGNVRELKNVIQRAYILADGDRVVPVPPTSGLSRALAETASTITFAVGTPMHEIEQRMLFKTLAYFDNNKARAAEALGVTTKTIYNRLTAYRANNPNSGETADDTANSKSA